MLRYEFTEPLYTEKNYSGKSCSDHITFSNAEWYLFQLKRDISMSAGIVESIQNEYFVDWHLPDSLRGMSPNRPTWLECSVYMTAIDAFYRYVSKVDISERVGALGLVVDTKIKVQGNKAMVFSDDLDVVDCIKNAVVEKGYKFSKATESEAKAWWAPITREL